MPAAEVGKVCIMIQLTGLSQVVPGCPPDVSDDDAFGVNQGLESEKHLGGSGSDTILHDNALHSLLYDYLGPGHVTGCVTDESVSTVREALPIV